MSQGDTPETDAFMLLIDDSEIDLRIVEAYLADMERQRDAAREDAERLAGLLKRHDEMRRKAENQGQSKEGYREFPICKETRDARAALAAHEALAKK